MQDPPHDRQANSVSWFTRPSQLKSRDRKRRSMREVLDEFNDTHAQVMSLAAQMRPETFRQTGTLPWYGMDYALDDFIVYTFYGHKREHSAQIAAFRDLLSK